MSFLLAMLTNVVGSGAEPSEALTDMAGNTLTDMAGNTITTMAG